MAFERSALGQSNRTIFLGVDAIVYVEGGQDKDCEQNESFDALFWLRLFEAYCPGKTFRILPRGSKDNVLSLIGSPDSSHSAKVFFAIDRDYDELYNNISGDNKIIYTFGYSFENDIFYEDGLVSLFLSVCPVVGYNAEIKSIVEKAVSQFNRDVRFASFADAAGVEIGNGVIDRKNPQRYFAGHTMGRYPFISKAALTADVSRVAKTPGRPIVTSITLTANMLPRLIVGHLWATFCFKLLAHLQKVFSSTTKLTHDGVMASAILAFANHCLGHNTSPAKAYYATAFAALAI